MNKQNYNSIDLAYKMCDTVINKYAVDQLPGPSGRFNYIQGVFLLGMERCYEFSKNPAYHNYIRSWVDYMIEEDGTIKLQGDMLDDLMPAVLLIRLYSETDEKKYITALEASVCKIKDWKRNKFGGFFHKFKTPNQMWLDGLFMAGILLTKYAKEFNRPEFFDEMHLQAMLMREHIRDRKTGLYYHAWDAECCEKWANPETGLSSEFWGRAMGWVAVALCEMLDNFPINHPKRQDLVDMLSELLESVKRYQEPDSGLWYQVVDKGDREDNWCETSCTSLFAYAFHKAVRMGYVGEEYAMVAQKAYDGIIRIISIDEGGIVIPEISIGTDVMDYTGYVARPRRDNDNHGTGTFVLMCCEFAL